MQSSRFLTNPWLDIHCIRLTNAQYDYGQWVGKILNFNIWRHQQIEFISKVGQVDIEETALDWGPDGFEVKLKF
jgi:hypothetical protein